MCLATLASMLHEKNLPKIDIPESQTGKHMTFTVWFNDSVVCHLNEVTLP